MGQSASTPAPPPSADLKASAARCPVDHSSTSASPPSASTSAAKCPVDHGAINASNNMPSLPQTPAHDQTSVLPTEREMSSIPRDDGARWEYPSPQQFHNALVRKGWETPEDSVEVMVQIHNFLNERAWDEVRRWESVTAEGADDLQLVRLRGRPGELSPKARLYMLAGWLLPSRFASEPPFDRHDWIVRRPRSQTDVRYVIDYYSAPPLPDGSPVFSLDVRPALDSPWSVSARAKRAWDEWKDSGERI